MDVFEPLTPHLCTGLSPLGLMQQPDAQELTKNRIQTDEAVDRVSECVDHTSRTISQHIISIMLLSIAGSGIFALLTSFSLSHVFAADVVYKNNDIRLELSRLARIADPKMKLQGDVVFKCENVPTLDPISFETPGSFLALPKWNTKRVGSISFDFRTSEPNGLILFTQGKPQDKKDSRSQRSNKVDFFAVELLDGNLYLLLDMGSGTIKVKATQSKVSDGVWHHVDIQRDGRSGIISVNSRRTPFTASGENEILDLEGSLYLGGLPDSRADLVLPTELWTAMLNYGYVGCVRDLFIDGRSKDIRQIAEAQSAAGIKSSCSKVTGKQCDGNPCKNNGVCREGWNRFICDCTATGHWDRTCERDLCISQQPVKQEKHRDAEPEKQWMKGKEEAPGALLQRDSSSRSTCSSCTGSMAGAFLLLEDIDFE
ncbi:hypothetical protein DNTS_018606 [Danionella cerebrum]|uniref:EGF-like domain-containing protein n=1 Tax=Danionella cerebrum TaxID=2873325 RepID=A0A553Q9N0_9TELE|nr:hypothetical protein DNTS_018606 [Danionella translucida]